MIFAVNKYSFNLRVPSNIACVGISLLGFSKLFLYSLKKDKFNQFQTIFNNYKDEVTKERLRGLKLYRGKHVNKVEEREFTTSNLDDIKDLIKH